MALACRQRRVSYRARICEATVIPSHVGGERRRVSKGERDGRGETRVRVNASLAIARINFRAFPVAIAVTAGEPQHQANFARTEISRDRDASALGGRSSLTWPFAGRRCFMAPGPNISSAR